MFMFFDFIFIVSSLVLIYSGNFGLYFTGKLTRIVENVSRTMSNFKCSPKVSFAETFPRIHDLWLIKHLSVFNSGIYEYL